MGAETKIQWCDHSWSPWFGCSKVSPGCTNCYAERQSHRNPGVLGVWGPNGTRVISKSWDKPLTWDRAARRAGERRRVFPSLCDVFEDRPELVEPRVRLFHLINETPNLDWLLLTKRPENVRRFWGGEGVPRSWAESMPSNVWLGTSVEDQARADERIPRLLEIPAAVRFLSCEPLLGSVSLSKWIDPTGACCGSEPEFQCRECPATAAWRYSGPADENSLNEPRLDWIIVGGESGPKARPCDIAWILSIVEQCRESGVPVFVKQLGAVPVSDSVHREGSTVVVLRDPKGGDPDEWPEDLRVREMPEILKPAENPPLF